MTCEMCGSKWDLRIYEIPVASRGGFAAIRFSLCGNCPVEEFLENARAAILEALRKTVKQSGSV